MTRRTKMLQSERCRNSFIKSSPFHLLKLQRLPLSDAVFLAYPANLSGSETDQS